MRFKSPQKKRKFCQCTSKLGVTTACVNCLVAPLLNNMQLLWVRATRLYPRHEIEWRYEPASSSERRRDNRFSAKWSHRRLWLVRTTPGQVEVPHWKKQKQTKSRIYHLNWKTVRWCWSDTREAALMRARGEPGCAWPRPASSNLTVSLWGNTKCLLHDIKLIHIQKKKRKEKKKWRKRVRPAWPLLTAAVCGVRTQGYLVRYLWLVLLMSDLLWTMRRTEVNSNERSNEMLLQDVCFCFLFTAWSFFIALQRRRWNLYTCIGITALAVVNVQGFFCFCFFGRVNILRWSTTCLLSD